MDAALDHLNELGGAKRSRRSDGDALDALDQLGRATSAPESKEEVGGARGRSMVLGRKLAAEKRAALAASEAEKRLAAAWDAVAAN